MNATSPAQTALKSSLIIKTTGRRRGFAERTAIARATAGPRLRNDLSPKLKIERRRVDELNPANRRVRRSSARQVERLVNIIGITGVCAPILVDRDGRVIDGHGVLEAAKALKIETIPCVLIDHLTESEIEFLKVAINRSAESGEWDLDELRPVLVDLREEGFVLTDTGFSVPELDSIVIGDGPNDAALDDELPKPPEVPVTRLGDLWLAGEHRVYCGDSTDAQSHATVLAGNKAHVIFTDPPWNVPIKGFVSSKHEDFKMAAGEMSDAEFASFIRTMSELALDALVDGGVMFTCIDWRSVELIIRLGREAGLQLINMAVWNKGSGGMGGLYRSAHELIPVFCNGASPRVNNIQLGKHGRDRTNVFSYPGANRRGSAAGEALKDHPTPKPADMVNDAIIDVTNPGELVFDPFLGSGTTLLAAERAGRLACCIELDPRYVDVAIARWEAETGQSAVHDETDLTFAELRQARTGDADE